MCKMARGQAAERTATPRRAATASHRICARSRARVRALAYLIIELRPRRAQRTRNTTQNVTDQNPAARYKDRPI